MGAQICNVHMHIFLEMTLIYRGIEKLDSGEMQDIFEINMMMKYKGFWWNVKRLDYSWKEGETGLTKDAVSFQD